MVRHRFNRHTFSSGIGGPRSSREPRSTIKCEGVRALGPDGFTRPQVRSTVCGTLPLEIGGVERVPGP